MQKKYKDAEMIDLIVQTEDNKQRKAETSCPFQDV